MELEAVKYFLGRVFVEIHGLYQKFPYIINTIRLNPVWKFCSITVQVSAPLIYVAMGLPQR